MKHKLWFAGIFVAAAGLWLAFSDPSMNWREEVQLQSGEVIVIKRTAKFSENWIAGGGGGSFNRGMTIDFDSPDKPDNPTVWSSLYDPLIIDQDPITKEWLIIATFTHCDGWYNIGRPKLPYTEYIFRNGKWEQGTLNPNLIGRLANLLLVDSSEIKTINSSRPIVKIAEKQKRITARSGIPPEYKSILNEWTTGC